jgi:hypothetical protein
MKKKVSALSLDEVNEQLQLLEYIATNTGAGLTEGDREFRRALESQKKRLLTRRGDTQPDGGAA